MAAISRVISALSPTLATAFFLDMFFTAHPDGNGFAAPTGALLLFYLHSLQGQRLMMLIVLPSCKLLWYYLVRHGRIVDLPPKL